MGWSPALIVGFVSGDGIPYTIAGPGDLNGDGYGDIVVGAPLWDDGLAWPDTGRAFVFAGGPDGPQSTPDWSFDGSNAEEFGSSVEILGDTNGDGFDELAIGAPGPFSGEAYVYEGSASGPVYALTVYGSQFGGWVAPAGDVSGDGYADLMVADPYAEGTFYFGVGNVRLYEGSATGLSTSSTASFFGEDSNENLGAALTAADVDGDGFSDLVLGRTNAYVGSGGLDVHHGSATGLAATVVTDDIYSYLLEGCDVNGDGYDDVLDLEFSDVYLFAGSAGGLALTPTLLTSLGSSGSGSYTRTISCAGDYNDDGYDDLLLTDASDGPGRVDLYAGSATGPNLAVPIHFYGEGSFGDFGYGARGVGDLNGDGYDDFAVLDPSASEMSIFFGLPDADGDGVTTAEDCDDADATVPLTLYDDLDTDGFGGASQGVGCPTPSSVLVGGDCDDTDSAIHPDAAELPADGIDSDCDDVDLCYVDEDVDGYRTEQTQTAEVDCAYYGLALATLPSGDCDDNDSSVNPGAADAPADGQDSDCDGTDQCYVDADSDGFRTEALVEASPACTELGTALASDPAGDCDDTNPDVSPDADELVGDEVDQDCNGRERCFVDEDEDGFRTGEDFRSDDLDCDDPGEAALDADTDCDDDDDETHPDADDVPLDGIDQDCDGEDATEDVPGGDDKADDKAPGCGCDAGSSGSTGSLLGGWALLTALLFRRR